MSDIRIPKKITPDPIVDSIIEFRFTTPIKKEQLITSLLLHFSKEFPHFREIPVAIGPISESTVVTSLNNADFSVNIGANVISFGSFKSYPGWITYSQLILSQLKALEDKNWFTSITRVGFRYINFFKNVELLSENINLDISFDGRASYQKKNAALRTELQKDDIGFNLILADNVIQNNNTGSILDIDAFCQGLEIPFTSRAIDLVARIHSEEKALFFSLLKPDFLNQFSPEY